jgi:hypothetical protein
MSRRTLAMDTLKRIQPRLEVIILACSWRMRQAMEDDTRPHNEEETSARTTSSTKSYIPTCIRFALSLYELGCGQNILYRYEPFHIGAQTPPRLSFCLQMLLSTYPRQRGVREPREDPDVTNKYCSVSQSNS